MSKQKETLKVNSNDVKEIFKKHQEAKKAELEKRKLKKIEAELKGHGEIFKLGSLFDGLE